MTSVAETFLWILLVLPGALGLLVAVGVCYAFFHERRLVRILAWSPCLYCGSPLGREAVLDARRDSAERMRGMREQNPGGKLRILMEWRIIRRACGKTVYYYPQYDALERDSRLSKLGGQGG